MITIDNVQYRNLEEQVQKNKDDIQYILEEEGVLNEFGIKVVGEITNISELPDPKTYQGDFGDAYAVGTSAPYTLYIYTRANSYHPTNYWFNIGEFPLPGPVGPTGAQGQKGDNGQSALVCNSILGMYSEPAVGTTIGLNPSSFNRVGTVGDTFTAVGKGTGPSTSGKSWTLMCQVTSVGSLTNFKITGFAETTGIQGIQGIQGEPGAAGAQGPQGPQGPKGDAGQSFEIVGIVSSESQLPTPSTLPDNQAYLVGTAAPYDMYVQVNDQWVNMGIVEGVVGPQGPQGPEGIQGVRGSNWYTGTDNPPPIFSDLKVLDKYLNTRTGNVYTYSGAKWSLQGNIMGPQGEQGPKGEQGPQGEPGASPDLSNYVTNTELNDTLGKYATTEYVDSKVTGVYVYKGSVATYNDLPSSGQTVGDVYNVEDTGDNYAWDGTAWDKLSGTVDLTNYYTKTQVDSGFIKSSGETSRTGTLPINVENAVKYGVVITTTDSASETCRLGVDNISFSDGGKGVSIYRTGQIFYNPVTGGNYTITLPKSDGTIALTNDITSQLSTKQDTLVSGTNIKTINGESVLGSGDLTISGGGGSNIQIYHGYAFPANGVTNLQLFPSDYDLSSNYITMFITWQLKYEGGKTRYYNTKYTYGYTNSINGIWEVYVPEHPDKNPSLSWQSGLGVNRFNISSDGASFSVLDVVAISIPKNT